LHLVGDLFELYNDARNYKPYKKIGIIYFVAGGIHINRFSFKF